MPGSHEAEIHNMPAFNQLMPGERVLKREADQTAQNQGMAAVEKTNSSPCRAWRRTDSLQGIRRPVRTCSSCHRCNGTRCKRPVPEHSSGNGDSNSPAASCKSNLRQLRRR